MEDSYPTKSFLINTYYFNTIESPYLLLQKTNLLKKDKSKRGTAGEKGTGLGMHLVKELVELNKGVVSAASELGKGTSFDLILPTNTIA